MDKYLQYIRVPFFFAEVLKLVVGLNFIFIINLLFKLDINQIPNFTHMGDIIKGTFLITSSYFLGRLFLIIANTWDILIVLLFKKDRSTFIKSRFFKFLEMINGDRTAITKENIIDYEIEEYIEKNKLQRDINDRDYYYRHFLGLTIGACIVLSYFSQSFNISIGLWITIFILTFMSFTDQINTNQKRLNIAQHIIKNDSKK